MAPDVDSLATALLYTSNNTDILHPSRLSVWYQYSLIVMSENQSLSYKNKNGKQMKLASSSHLLHQ